MQEISFLKRQILNFVSFYEIKWIFKKIKKVVQ